MHKPPLNGFNARVYVKHPHWGDDMPANPAWARFLDDDTADIIYIRKNGDYGGLYMNVPVSLIVKRDEA